MNVLLQVQIIGRCWDDLELTCKLWLAAHWSAQRTVYKSWLLKAFHSAPQTRHQRAGHTGIFLEDPVERLFGLRNMQMNEQILHIFDEVSTKHAAVVEPDHILWLPPDFKWSDRQQSLVSQVTTSTPLWATSVLLGHQDSCQAGTCWILSCCQVVVWSQHIGATGAKCSAWLKISDWGAVAVCGLDLVGVPSWLCSDFSWTC